MSILSTNKKLINIGKEYSAGNGIDITNEVISVSGNIVPYSAGANIDIQDHTISSKDWSNDITEASANAYNETTAWVQENYTTSADVSFLSAEIDNKLDSSAWSTVSGSLATEDYVILSDNLTYSRATAFTTAQEYAKESACNSAFDYLNQNKLDVSAFNLPNSANWNEATNVVESNSAAWFDNVGDAEVNSWVYNNSASTEDTTNVVETNSASWSNGGGIYDVVTANSASWNEVSSKVDTNEFATISSMFSGAIDYVSSNAGDQEVSNVVHSNSSTWNTVNDKLDSSAIGIRFSVNNVVSSISGLRISAWTAGNASYAEKAGMDGDGKRFTTAYAKVSALNDKLDTTAFSTISGDFLTTSFGISESAKWEEATNCVETNSGAWFDNVGDAEVNSFVYNNSSTIVDVDSVVQSNSASWGQSTITSPYNTILVDGSKIEGTNSAINLTGNITPYTTATAVNVTQLYDVYSLNFGTFGTGSILTISGDGYGYSPKPTFVIIGNDSANNQISLEFNSQSGNLGNIVSDISAWFIEGETGNYNFELSSYTLVSAVEELAWKRDLNDLPSYEYLQTNYQPQSAMGAYYTTAEANSLSSMLSGAIDYVSANAGDDFPQSADEAIQAYQTNSGTYLTGIPEDLNVNSVFISAEVAPGQSEIKNVTITPDGIGIGDDTVGYGEVTLQQITSWDEVRDFVSSNSASWGDSFDPSYISGVVDNKLDTTAFSTVSGSFLTAHQDLSNYYTTADANTLSSMLSGAIDYVSANAGDEFPASANEAITAYQNASGTYLTAHQIIPSAKWENASDVVQSNSATWDGVTACITEIGGDIKVDSVELTGGDKTVTTIAPIGEDSELQGVIISPTGISFRNDIEGGQDITVQDVARWNEITDVVSSNSASWANNDLVTAYNELKASYDALSSLFSTYSGKWLLPNEPAVQYVLSSMTANVEINDGSWDHGGDVEFSIPQEVSAFTLGLEQGKLSAIFNVNEYVDGGDKIRYSYNKYYIPDDDFCGTWTGDGNVVTAMISGFGANSASPTGYPVYMGFPYLQRYADMINPVTFSGYVPVQQGV